MPPSSMDKTITLRRLAPILTLTHRVFAHLKTVRIVDQPTGDIVRPRGKILESRVESEGGLATTLVSVVTLRGSRWL